MEKSAKRTKSIKICIVVFVVVAASIGTYFILDNTLYAKGEPTIYNCGLKIATLDGTESENGTANNDHIRGFCGWGMRDLSMSAMPNGEHQLQSCFKWYVDKDTEVLSCVDGTVKRIEWQNYSGDYQVQIVPEVKGFGKADWFINMDHILPIEGLKEGSSVKANQVIGKPGNDQGAYWMFELEFRKISDGQHYPTAKFWANEIKEEYGQRMIKMMNDLEYNVYHVARGAYYNYSTMIYVACWLEAIPAQYYQYGYPGHPGYTPDSGGSKDDNNGNSNKVSWTVTANGTPTTEILFTFDKDVPLTLGYIIVEHAKKGTLTGSGKNWTLTISGIDSTTVDGAKVVVTLSSPSGYKIEPITKTVAIIP